MQVRTPRLLIAVVFMFFVAVAASAAPEGRSEAGDWVTRQFHRIVVVLKNFFTISPLDDPASVPPHP